MRKYNNDIRFFKDFMNNLGVALHVAQLAKITSVTDGKKECDLQPLALNADGEKRSLLLGVPVVKHCRKDLAVGDVAVVVFLDRNAENWDGSNKTFELANSRTHSINDAIVVGVI